VGTERKFVFRQVFSKSLTHPYTREWLKWRKRRVKAAHTVRQSVCLHQNRQTYPSILPRAAPAFLASPRRSRAHIRLLTQRTSTQQRMIRPRLSAPTIMELTAVSSCVASMHVPASVPHLTASAASLRMGLGDHDSVCWKARA